MAFQLNGADRTISNSIKLVKCGECGRNQSPLPVCGIGSKQVLVVFDHPTIAQVNSGDWFAGEPSVFKEFLTLGGNPYNDFWVTAALPCGGKGTHTEPCLSKLEQTIKQLNPVFIVAVGPVAAGAVLRLYNQQHFKPNSSVSQYHGHVIPFTENGWNCWFMSVMSDVELHTNQSRQLQNIGHSWLRKQLRAVLHLVDRPTKTPAPKEELLYDSASIIKALDEAMESKYAAFDYETNCLQPESTEAKILCAALTYGDSEGPKRTVAFPMSSKEVERKWCEFLQSPVLKIGANIKFEHRWSSVLLKTSVVNWFWDICVGARILDCVPGNSGLKFQTFVNFGVVGYDDSVEPYMKGGEYNKLDQAPVSDLLTYNAFDAYYTYLTAMTQRKIFHLSF